jgi:hypothetical protein
MWKFISPNERRRLAVPKIIDDSSITGDEKASSALPAPDRDVEFGAVTAVKTLYAGKNSRQGSYDWVDSPPKALSKKVAKAHDRVCPAFSLFLSSSQSPKMMYYSSICHVQEDEM